LSGLSGLVDIAAITLTLSQMFGTGSLDAMTMSQGILLAVLSNTIIKAALAAFFGTPILRKEVLIVLGVTSLGVIACCRFLVR
jgi:uncharacterized membrane protein (DUF4010 family)